MTQGDTIGSLQRQLETALAERDQARVQQAALAEVLQAINAATGDFAPVYDLIIARAMALCDAPFGSLLAYDGRQLTMLAERNGPPSLVEYWLRPQPVAPESATNRTLREGKTSQIVDLSRIDSYLKDRLAMTVASVELGGIRTLVQVPLVGERGTIGVFILYRQEVRPFTEAQVAMVEAFAAQATIAMENARRFAEQRETLDQQTATAEILSVINASPGDLSPVFQAILEKSRRLCDAAYGDLWTYDGNLLHLAATQGEAAFAAWLKAQGPVPVWPGSPTELLLQGADHVQYEDPIRDGRFDSVPEFLAQVQRAGICSTLFVPMWQDGVLLGVIIVYRREVRRFADKQVGVLQGFAAQAVIAMENARLLTEQREALEQQTATTEVLEVINASPGSLEPVFEAMLEKAMHLCEAAFGMFFRYDGAANFDQIVHRGVPTSVVAGGSRISSPPANSGLGRMISGDSVVQIVDLPNTDLYRSGYIGIRVLVEAGANTAIFVALRKDEVLQGAIIMYRKEVRAFSDKQVALLQNFAAQAVIAMENARLLTEQREALEQQTAMADILGVINTSPGDLMPVFRVVLEKAHSVCGADMGSLFLRDGDNVRAITTMGYDVEIDAILRQPRPPMPAMKALIDGQRFHHLADLQDGSGDGARAFGPQFQSGSRIRTNLIIPLRKEGTVLGFISANRREVRPYSDKEIGLIENFAAQAVIAMENARLLGELRDSLEQQTATADILRVIAQSPTDVAPVLEAVTQAALRFCGAEDVAIDLREGEIWRCVAHAGILKSPVGMTNAIGRKDLPGRTMLDRAVTQIPDVEETTGPETEFDRGVARQVGFRAALAAPMMRQDEAVGALILHRTTPGAFSDRQIALLESFAAQAVIALENTRLFTELKEALDQQTATADILRVISQSPTDVQPVLNVVVKAAQRFCGADDVVISLRDGDELTIAAHDGPITAPPPRRKLDRSSAQGRAVIDGKTIHLPNIPRLDPAEWNTVIELTQRFGAKASVAAPMLREGTAVGAIMLRRREAAPFTERQIALLEAFAAQAVIAIENVRLFTELRQSLEQQTASAEVLQVISQSPTDVTPVLDAVAEAAARLCDGADTVVMLREGNLWFAAAHDGPLASPSIQLRRQLTRETAPGRAMLDRSTVHFPDTRTLDPVEFATEREISERLKFRATVAVPMLRDGESVGAVSLRKSEPGPFSSRQIAQLETFAAQAVIAIENVRLFTELKESLDQQTATADILRVISQSPTDVQPVLEAVGKAALRFCGAEDVVITLRQGEHWLIAGHEGPMLASIGTLNPLNRQTSPSWAILDARTIHLPDIPALDPVEFASAHDFSRRQGFKAAVAAPMLREGQAIGAIAMRRTEAGAFTPRQIALLENFAAQAVIAIENVRLFTELQKRTDDLTESLEYQTATSELLEVISRSDTDIQPVFDTMLASAARLCGVEKGDVAILQGDAYRHVAFIGCDPDELAWLKTRVTAPGRGTSTARALIERRTDHVLDQSRDPERIAPKEATRERTTLAVPLLRNGEPLGVISLLRDHVEPFAERQIALIETFADQAVIAMENARLLSELRDRTNDLTESLEYQTATSELLEVISRSTSDIQPVLDTLVASAARLCDAELAAMIVKRDGRFRYQAFYGDMPDLRSVMAAREVVPGMRGSIAGRTLSDAAVVHVTDLQADSEYALPEVLKAGIRSALGVPLLRDGEAIGVINLTRSRVEPFTERQIELVRTFADQAVIAMENARLLSELRESLEYQTATSEVLEVISRSGATLQPVLDTMLGAALRLCRTESGGIAIQQGEGFHYVATLGWEPEADRIFRDLEITPGRDTVAARALAEGRIIQVSDVASDPEFAFPEMARLARWHTALGVPLMRDGRPIGVIAITRDRVEPFGEREVALVRTFADQAVIAIENARLLGELRESLDQQTAMAEVLGLINSSTGNITPVLDAMVDKAMALCEAPFGHLFSWDGESLHSLSTHHAFQDTLALFDGPLRVEPGSDIARILGGEKTVQYTDISQSEAYRRRAPLMVRMVEQAGIRTMITVPLVSEHGTIGLLSLYRLEVRPFTDKQVALVEAFAQQAVVAMENARLLGELTRREEELRATFDHMGDGVVMFDADLQLASWNRNFQELLEIPDSFLATRPGVDDYVRLLVERGELGAGNVDEEIARYHQRINEAWSAERTRPDGRIIEVRANPVPGGGSVLIYADITERKKAEAEIAAARDAAEAALERQTATADILKVIASSPSDTQPSFDAIADSANRLLGGLTTAVWRFEGEVAVLASFTSINPDADQALRAVSPLRTSDFAPLALVKEGKIAQHADIDEMSEGARELALKRGYRSQLLVPLLSQGNAIGFFSVTRASAGGFDEADVQLLRTFADQATIAIENARLFNDLRASLDQQTATADILRVIASSPTDVQPVLDVLAKAAVRFCGATDAAIHMREGNDSMVVAHEGPLPLGPTQTSLTPLNRETGFGMAILDCATIHRPDVQALDPIKFAAAHAFARELGFRAVLVVPLRREGTAIGAISLRRSQAGAFGPQQIELLETFAAQAVIAIENVRLFTELRDSLERLKAAQANLVQSEKMASLGQLTAGIAHEIKNPLNFVNNFATLSVDLLDELKEVAGPAFETLDEDKRAELDETMGLLVGNLGKIAEHGKRADGIVKSMLSHSRGGTGDWAPSDINALVEEALNLAYHGARAQDKEFNVTLERDLEKESKPIDVVPQDVTRVFLNLFGNGFYAANKRRLADKQAGFKPILKVTTRETGDGVEVKVRDNGTGIPPEVREKLFQPFFTTKPTGEGTGLGLSISYDIVTQQHGGTIEVESEVGQFTEFTVRLPRGRRVVPAEKV